MKKNPFTIKIERTDAQIDLVKKLGSRNKVESMAAAEAIAAILPQPILQVILQAALFSSLYTTQGYDAGTAPFVNLDPYFDIRAKNFVQVWSQFQPGGTATNFSQGLSQLFVQVAPLTSAVSANKNSLRAADLDYLGAVLTKMAQEVLVQQEINAAQVLMGSIAGARIDFNAANTATDNLIISRSTAANIFGPADFNNIMTKYDRVVSSFVGGTPMGGKNGIDTIVGSVEWMGQVRAMAYNPVNTRNGAETTSGASSLAAPEALREEIFRNAGLASFFGVELRKAWELGVGKEYNAMLSTYLGSTAILGHNDSGSGAFTPASEEFVIGLNSQMFDLVRMRERDGGQEVIVTPDDTFTIRSDKVGFVGEVREGYVSIDGRAKYALVY
jgi:hypothetical protein